MDMAGIRLLEIRNDAQKRGLTATRRADEGNELAFVDLQVHVGESINRTIRSLIGQRQSANVDDGGSRMACDRPSVGGNRSGAVSFSPNSLVTRFSTACYSPGARLQQSKNRAVSGRAEYQLPELSHMHSSWASRRRFQHIADGADRCMHRFCLGRLSERRPCRNLSLRHKVPCGSNAKGRCGG